MTTYEAETALLIHKLSGDPIVVTNGTVSYKFIYSKRKNNWRMEYKREGYWDWTLFRMLGTSGVMNELTGYLLNDYN